LIGENEILTNNPLVKFEQKSFVEKNESGASLFLLSNHGNGKQMDTFLIEFEPGADDQGNNEKPSRTGILFCSEWEN
jgi:XRE family transcriptional regulator, regulator of sulfur utilization